MKGRVDVSRESACMIILLLLYLISYNIHMLFGIIQVMLHDVLLSYSLAFSLPPLQCRD